MPEKEQPCREPLVLLPGMMCDGRIFEEQIRTFSGSMPVMVLPLAGGSTVAEIAERMLGHLPPRFALVGYGMGGVVALELIRRAPQRISRLCLMAVSPLADTPLQAADREPQIVAARAGRLADVLPALMPLEALAPGPRRQEIHDRWLQMAQALGPELFVTQARLMQRRPDQQAVLRRIHVPALALCGAEDPLAPVCKHELLAQMMPQGRLEVVENAGHLPLLEQPAVVNRALLHWLAMPNRAQMPRPVIVTDARSGAGAAGAYG